MSTSAILSFYGTEKKTDGVGVEIERERRTKTDIKSMLSRGPLKILMPVC